MSKETSKACLLSKETRYFISEHSKKKKNVKKGATNVSVSEGLPSGEASKSNKVATKKKEHNK